MVFAEVICSMTGSARHSRRKNAIKFKIWNAKEQWNNVKKCALNTMNDLTRKVERARNNGLDRK
jgi:hypothetical protein